MAVDQGPRVSSHLTNELFEVAIVSSPLFDLGDQFHRHIEGARAAPGLEGQVPARLGTTGAFEGRQMAFHKRADLSDVAQKPLARLGVTVRDDPRGVHV